MRRKTMSLNLIHRAASIARRKTFASFKSVFSSHGHSRSSPMLLSVSGESFLTSEIGADRVKSLSGSDGGAPTINHEERIFHAFDGSDTSDDEAYYTANEDCREFEDRDSDNCSGEAVDVERTEDAMREGFSKDYGQQWYRRSTTNGNSSKMGIPVSELRDSVINSESEEHPMEVEDAALLRFLKARNMDVGKAHDMFVKDWRWRNQFAPQGYLSEDDVSRQLLAEKAFLQGIDRRGRPLLVIIGAKHFSKGRDMEEFKRYCYYCLEKVIASMPEGKEQFVTIFDAGDTGYRNMDTSASLMMADFLQAHYPERMAQIFLVHVSSMFQGGYRLIEPAIDVKTRKKIVIVGDRDMRSLLRKEIGNECLPKVYGGSAELIPIQYAKINSATYPCRAVSSQWSH